VTPGRRGEKPITFGKYPQKGGWIPFPEHPQHMKRVTLFWGIVITVKKKKTVHILRSRGKGARKKARLDLIGESTILRKVNFWGDVS